MLEFEGALAIEYSHSATHWVIVSHGSDGFYSDYRYISEKPHIAAELEGRVFIGLSLAPLIDIASGKLVKLELELQAGFEATLAMRSDEAAHGIRHSCLECYSGDISFVAKVIPSLILLNWDRLELSAEFSKAIKLCDIYRSSVVGGIRFGTCPYQEYRVMFYTKSEDGFSVGNVEISENAVSWGRTNDYGTLVIYLPASHYKFVAEINGGMTNAEIFISEPSKVTITLGKGVSINTNPGEGLDISEWIKMVNADDILVSEIVDMESVLRTPLTTYEGHTYTLFDGAASTWDEAKAYCEALGGHLATIANADENTFLYEYMRSSGYSDAYWGLTDREVEGVWEWCTGEPVTYLNWASGEPNDDFNSAEDYGMYWGDKPNGFWNDGRFGDDGCAFLCEWDFILTEITEQPDVANTIAPNALYPGDYGTEVTDTYTLKTASFKDLVPNEQYVLLAMASIELENPLASDNLLFIDQTAAAEDGTLTFRYVQRTPCDISYVVACGASHKDLNDAEISFPEMVADGELQVVDPVVVYDGVTLTEGRDYVIVGSVDFTEAGEYTCYIRGIHNYTGSVECTYTVGQAENPFVDVADDSFCIDAVLWAVEEGITKGITDTRFAPDDLTTRGQIVTFLWRAAGEPEPASNANPFTDVKEEDFCYKAVLWAVENGITKGMTETIFAPNSSCTRAQAVTFLHRYMGKPAYTITGSGFTDVTDPEEFCYDAILWAVENGITGGLGDGTFGVDQTCTRGQIVTFLYRTLA